MNRRESIKLLAGAAVLGMTHAKTLAVGSEATARPNILLFFTDDQRASTIGALGNPHIRTPNLDKLVARGTASTRAYMMGGMTGATCVPSRAMLHTGRHLFHLHNRGSRYSEDDTTIAETFRAAGYTTYFTGKTS